MSLMLIIGNITLDIVNTVPHYPREDEELRSLQQTIQVGGNAANTASVLSAFRHRCDLVASIATDVPASIVHQQLQTRTIGLHYLYAIDGTTPTSYITLNQQSGSRTIIHYRDLPELPASHIEGIDVQRYDWIHFEGRNVDALAHMLHYTRDNIIDQPISLEIEKPRRGLTDLIPLVDVVMFSKTYAQAEGFDDAAAFLSAQHTQHPSLWMTCTWGDAGAWAIDQWGEVSHTPATSNLNIVQTIGAGDTFNAGLIHALATGQPLREALNTAVKTAEKQIQQNI